MASSTFKYSRRASNDLAASVRLDQLRALQSQLSSMIQDAKEDDEPPTTIDDSMRSTIDDSMHSTSTLSRATGVSSALGWERDASEGEALLSVDENDLEAGLMPKAYKPRRKNAPLVGDVILDPEPELPTTQRPGRLRPSTVKSARQSMAINVSGSNGSTAGSELSDDTKSHLSGSDGSERSTDPTVGTGQSALDVSDTARSRWARARSRSFSRPRRRNAPNKNESIDASSRSTSSKRSSLSRRSSLGRLPTYDFLTKEDDKEEHSLRPGAKWWHAVFLFSLIAALACIITLWAPYPIGARMPSSMIATMPWSNGCQGIATCICPRETICADDLLSMIFLTIARVSAWFDYPLYMMLFLSKANNLNNFLQKTALRCWMNFSDYHRVHSLFGAIVGLECTSHSFFHLVRWARRRDDIQLLWTTKTGITGLIALTITPLIVLPMTVPYLKSRMTFEWRKGLHYLSVVWGVALMCHAPQRIFWLVGVPVFIYAADKLVEALFKTHLLESAHFQRLGDSSCLITFENPPGFGKQNSAYLYLMLPWLSKSQFHAFTVFPGTKPNTSNICISQCGDWTKKLMKTITTPTHKPAFVVGPFLSPFSSPAMDSENLVAVASGIGVTPAISLIRQYSSTSRRLNLVWICRDAGLVENFLENVDFGSDGYTLIYYTGKRNLILRDELPPNVLLFNGRPNLERTISGIITSIATGEGLPEELHKKVLTRTPAEMRTRLLLEKALSIYTIDQLFDYTVKASEHHNAGLDPLIDEVNYQGVMSTMKHLLVDDVEKVRDKITRNFEKIDIDGDCRLGRDQFEDFFDLMIEGTDDAQGVANVKRGLKRMSTCRDMFESGRANTKKTDSGQWRDEFGIRRHLQGDGKFAAKNWAMLYCGGSQPVLDQLKDFKRKFGIGLSVEKFDW